MKILRRLPKAYVKMLAGPDGNSMMCMCGAFAYVEVVEQYVTCLNCGAATMWHPSRVLCANPHHDDPTGCESPLCWKRRSGL